MSRETEKEKTGGGAESILSRLRENLLFFLHFTRHPVKIGAPLPCSRDIAETVRTELVSKGARRVIELGAGMGSLTWGILKAVDHDTKLLCVESQPAFCRRLKRTFGERVEVVEADALHIQSIVRSTAWDKPDAIVSSVPLANRFARFLCKEIAELLFPDGLYLQVANFYSAVEAHFNIDKTHYFLRNLPPERLHRAFPKKGERHAVGRDGFLDTAGGGIP